MLLFTFPRVYNILDSGYSDRRFGDIRGKNTLSGIGRCRTENFVILRMLLSSEHGTYQDLQSENRLFVELSYLGVIVAQEGDVQPGG